MKANILYKCKACGQRFIGKTVDYKVDNFNINCTLTGQLKACPTWIHECEEDIKSGVAEIIGVEKIE